MSEKGKRLEKEQMMDVITRTTLRLEDLSNGAILGWAKNGKTRDAHFGYIDWTGTVDSMDPNRPAAKNYTVNTYRILKEKNYRGNK